MMETGLVSAASFEADCIPSIDTLRKKLERRLQSAEKLMNELKTTIALLDQNPAFEQLHDSLRKVGI